VHSVTKNLDEHADKLDDATKEEVKAAIEVAKKVDEGADLETLRAAITDLSSASMKIGQAMYGKKDESGGAEGDDSNSSSGSEGKEAEYEEKKEDEKK